MAVGFTHILVPLDFNPASDEALVRAKQLADRFNARLSLLHVVVDPKARGTWTADIYVPAIPEVRDLLVNTARAQLAAAVTDAERDHLRVTVDARVGAVADVILDVARTHHIDLIVMGTHGRRGLSHLVMGSIAEKVVREAPCPVMTTHAADATRASTVLAGTVET
ncbi:MAG TPA: universal stress protein [Vicinamibacterales bacterium]|nr:universal stress protein [Vicinamibacterales bacterium]